MKNDTSTSVLAAIVGVFIALAVVIPIVIYHAWAFTTLWNWFVPSIFVGLPLLTLVQGIALSLVVGVFRVKMAKTKSEEPVSDFVIYLLAPLTGVGIGYVLKFWVGV